MNFKLIAPAAIKVASDIATSILPSIFASFTTTAAAPCLVVISSTTLIVAANAN